MTTDRFSVPSGSPTSARMPAPLQSAIRSDAAPAAEGHADPMMAAPKLTLPPRRTKLVVAATEMAPISFLDEEPRRSTLIGQSEAHILPLADPTLGPPDQQLANPLVSLINTQLHTIAAKGLDLKNLAENVEKAKSVNVDPAKRDFWRKFVGMAVSLGVVAFFTVLTITTGGAALIAGLSVASIMLVKNSGDTYCALKVLENKQFEAGGLPAPHKDVPMGSDWIGNLCHSALSRSNRKNLQLGNLTEEDLKAKAKSWSLGINIALKVVSFSATGVAGIAAGADWIPRVASIAFSAGTLAVAQFLDSTLQSNQAKIKDYADEKLVGKMVEFSKQFESIFENALGLTQEKQDALFETLTTGLAQLDQDLDELSARLSATERRLNAQPMVNGEVVSGIVVDGVVLNGFVQAGRRGLEQWRSIHDTGMNLEAEASSIMLFKSAFDCWRVMNDLSKRNDMLTLHLKLIEDLKKPPDPPFQNSFA
jgi:hypothetical protein